MKRVDLALIVAALAGLATAVVAESTNTGRIEQASFQPQTPQAAVRAAAAIPYPRCPEGFQLAEQAPQLFQCHKLVSLPDFLPALQAAENMPCAPDAYWNIGPEIFQSARDGGLVVNFRCRRGS